MAKASLKVIAVVGSLHKDSVCRAVILQVARKLSAAGCSVDVLDLLNEPLALYNPDTAHGSPAYSALRTLGGTGGRCSPRHAGLSWEH